MGQHDLSEVYQNYEAYIAGSTSEGFGLTLMEAVGGGLQLLVLMFVMEIQHLFVMVKMAI